MICKFVLIVFASVGMLVNPVLADEAPGGTWTEIQGFDDWPAFNMLADGKMWCPGSELVFMNPLTPTCGDGKRFHIRKAEMFSCVTAVDMGYGPEPRFTGTMWFSVNGNLDETFSGPVFGKWVMVPGAACDPADLVDPVVYWEGSWQGKRKQVCDPTCWWIGSLHVVGYGYGGGLEGLEFHGEETIFTYTPMPAPWEHIPGFPYSGPEGVIHGFIRE